ncbi:hypothetical protein PIIN_10150 [Serendipita indica DSM 11827]|uniref:Uncharacterized protein n=1 Tax=Serendipita indica (strain DSM 11827) TaxID=1109443 RepID=G4TXV7_SERID|nr:hypothetical protein PIIN_10150 [Serendipita indica DSM 11827]
MLLVNRSLSLRTTTDGLNPQSPNRSRRRPPRPQPRPLLAPRPLPATLPASNVGAVVSNIPQILAQAPIASNGPPPPSQPAMTNVANPTHSEPATTTYECTLSLELFSTDTFASSISRPDAMEQSNGAFSGFRSSEPFF